MYVRRNMYIHTGMTQKQSFRSNDVSMHHLQVIYLTITLHVLSVELGLGLGLGLGPNIPSEF